MSEWRLQKRDFSRSDSVVVFLSLYEKVFECVCSVCTKSDFRRYNFRLRFDSFRPETSPEFRWGKKATRRPQPENSIIRYYFCAETLREKRQLCNLFAPAALTVLKVVSLPDRPTDRARKSCSFDRILFLTFQSWQHNEYFQSRRQKKAKWKCPQLVLLPVVNKKTVSKKILIFFSLQIRRCIFISELRKKSFCTREIFVFFGALRSSLALIHSFIRDWFFEWEKPSTHESLL